MQWSKLKSMVEAKFAASVADRIAIHSARYGNCTCGRAWLTVDGEEVANFCTRAYWNRRAGLTPSEESAEKYAKMPVQYGELSRQDAYAACWAFVHDLSIDQALSDTDPLVQALAVLDARVGKRRLMSLNTDAMHPLAQRLLSVRRKSENP